MGSSDTQSELFAVGLFRYHADAEHGYRALRTLGYQENEITVVLSRETKRKHFAHPTEGASEEPAPRRNDGSEAEGLVASLVSRGSTVMLPDLELRVAGPLVATFAQGASDTEAVLLAVLRSIGLSQERARVYERGLRAGAILLSVVPPHPEAARLAGNALREARAEHLFN